MTIVELDPTAAGAPAASVTTLVASRPRSRRGWPAVAALVVAALVGTWLLGRDDGSPSGAPATGTTVVPAPGPLPVDVGGPAPSATTGPTGPNGASGPNGPNGTAGPTVPPTAPAGGSAGALAPAPVPTTTAVRFLHGRPVPVLDGAQGDASLWVVADDELVHVEMATGAITRSTLPGPGRIVGAAPGLVVVHVPRSNLLVVQRTDGSLPVRHAIGADTPVGLSGSSGVWLVGAVDQRSEQLPVRLLGIDGSTVAAFELPVGFFPRGFGADRLWGERFGRIWTAGLDGQVRAYAAGALVAVAGRQVLWAGCDDVLRCTYRLGTTEQLDLGITSLPVVSQSGAPELGALAPDGRSALATVPGPKGPQVVDLVTGRVREIDNAQFGDLAWSPDGDWLVLSQTSLTLLATNVRDGRRVELVLGFLARDIGSIAIG